jgi:hypothetical protein
MTDHHGVAKTAAPLIRILDTDRATLDLLNSG